MGGKRKGGEGREAREGEGKGGEGTGPPLFSTFRGLWIFLQSLLVVAQRHQYKTKSSAVAEKPRDGSCLSV